MPAGSVVVPGTLPSEDGKYWLYCAVIVKRVDAQTRAKVASTSCCDCSSRFETRLPAFHCKDLPCRACRSSSCFSPACVSGPALAQEQASTRAGHYLFVWAGDYALQGNDFLAVIDADPASASYGRLTTTLATDQKTLRVHHTEYTMPASGMLFANDHDAGPHFHFRRARPAPSENSDLVYGHGGLHAPALLRPAAQRQCARDVSACARCPWPGSARRSGGHVRRTGGDRRPRQGHSLRQQRRSSISRRSVDALWPRRRPRSRPRRVHELFHAPRRHFQRHHVSGLASVRSQAAQRRRISMWVRTTMPRSARRSRDSARMGPSSCRVSAAGSNASPEIQARAPRSQLVYTFPGNWCGVPTIVGHYLVQSVPAVHGLIVLDIADPARANRGLATHAERCLIARTGQHGTRKLSAWS